MKTEQIASQKPRQWNPDIEVVEAETMSNFTIFYKFNTGESFTYSISHLLKKGNFRRLSNEIEFNKMSIEDGTIVWGDDVDIALEELYINGEELQNA